MFFPIYQTSVRLVTWITVVLLHDYLKSLGGIYSVFLLFVNHTKMSPAKKKAERNSLLFEQFLFGWNVELLLYTFALVETHCVSAQAQLS